MDNKRGQVAIFVIIALIIIAVILVIFLYPKIGPRPPAEELSPETYLKKCIEPVFMPTMERLSKNGGYFNPEGALEYKGEKIKYLCYTREYYTTCVIQQPMIKENYEKELKEVLDPKAKECVQSLKEQYEKSGYQIINDKAEINVSILPKRIILSFLAPMTISKDNTRTFNEINIELKSELYDLLLTSTSILEFESTLGDSEITAYSAYYPDLIIKKDKLSEGSKVYTLRNVVTNESFRFASRSLSWPPGGYLL
ncbi:MAG: hypothetical protein Q8Q31_00170 [Nanoarchaeota archaeon]|nr:hypothetical protein [Nanoarchaeota archaeon]